MDREKLFNKILEEKFKALELLIDDKEEFNLVVEIIKNKAIKKLEWKFTRSKQDVFEVVDSLLNEEILTRKLLKNNS